MTTGRIGEPGCPIKTPLSNLWLPVPLPTQVTRGEYLTASQNTAPHPSPHACAVGRHAARRLRPDPQVWRTQYGKTNHQPAQQLSGKAGHNLAASSGISIWQRPRGACVLWRRSEGQYPAKRRRSPTFLSPPPLGSAAASIEHKTTTFPAPVKTQTGIYSPSRLRQYVKPRLVAVRRAAYLRTPARRCSLTQSLPKAAMMESESVSETRMEASRAYHRERASVPAESPPDPAPTNRSSTRELRATCEISHADCTPIRKASWVKNAPCTTRFQIFATPTHLDQSQHRNVYAYQF